MLLRVLFSLGRQLRRLFVVAAVALAAYVSLGRQFMPAIADYTEFVETQLFELTGLPVEIATLTGSFSGFNPTVEINGFSLLVTEAQLSAEGEAAGLVFSKATLTLDVPSSLWQRRWVFAEFVVSELSLALREDANANWQLRGLSGSTPQRVDVAELYSALLGVSYLRLTDVELVLEPEGLAPVSLDVVDARIQNRGDEHVVRLDARLPGVSQALQLSYEGRGDQLDTASAFAYANVPTGDHFSSFGFLLPAPLREALADVIQLRAGGEVWIEIDDGQLAEATTTLNLDSLQLERPGRAANGYTELADFRGVATIRQSQEHALAGGERPQFEFVVQGTRGNWDGVAWEPFRAGFVLRQNDEVELRADSLDLGRLLGLAGQFATVGLLPVSESALDTINTLAPRGRLRNLSVKLEGGAPLNSPLEALASPVRRLELRANTEAIAIESLGGVPMLDGVTGYLQLDYDGVEKRASGFAEVDSDALRMRLPNVFTRVWEYDSVNGRIDFAASLADGLDLTLASNTVSAQSENTRGRVQFTSSLRKPLSGEPSANLDLLVGVESMDAVDRYSYLPDGASVEPGLRATMAWVGEAVQSGSFFDSGAIYRGSTLLGAPPETKTFQSFYRLKDGNVRYAEGWPAVTEAEAFVTTADSLIDVEVSAGRSLGLVLDGASGSVRPERDAAGNIKNRLLVSGIAAGETQDALAFLGASPLPSGLTETVSSWEANGDMDVAIDVELLLGSGEAVDVRTDLRVENNVLDFTEYGLQVDALGGRVVFDTRSGLSSEGLEGSLFDKPVALTLGSRIDSEGVLDRVSVSAKGTATPQDIIQLALTGVTVDAMLGQAEGLFDFDAALTIAQNTDAEYPTQLTVISQLEGMTLDAPAPFAKTAEERRDFKLVMAFKPSAQWFTGNLGPEVEFDLRFADDTLDQGLVFLGESPTELSTLTQSPYQGLVVLGALESLEYERWEDLLNSLSVSASGGGVVTAGDQLRAVESIAESVGFVDVEVEQLGFFGQNFADMSLRLRPEMSAQRWLVDLAGPELEGHLEVPFEGGALLVALQRLRLAGGEQDQAGPQPRDALVSDGDTVDSLAALDPRSFPELRFSTREFSIGDTPYGSWRFHLQPETDGARFTDLAFDFRGLQLAPELLADERIESWEPDDEQAREGEPSAAMPEFFWSYDGQQHRSDFGGNLRVANLADVLRANGYAASLESDSGEFDVNLSWPGTPALFAADALSGEVRLDVREGRFLQGSGGAGALKLISILNFDAIMRRLRFSDDLLRSGLAFDQISGHLVLESGQVAIQDRLVISGPSSLYQITGDVNLVDETILGEMYVTLPVSNNIPWLGLLTANLPIAVGAYLFDQIFGDQVDSLTSAAYTLDGPWEGLEPEFKQAFGSPDSVPERDREAPPPLTQ